MKICHSKRVSQGFTLVELMVILAVIAIMVAFAVPSFQDTISKARTNSMANQLSNDLSYAKSEALMRGELVSMLPYGDKDWNQGWCVFLDKDAPTATNCSTIAPESLLFIEKDSALKSVTVTVTTDITTEAPIAKLAFGSDAGVLLQEGAETKLSRKNKPLYLTVKPKKMTAGDYRRAFALEPWGTIKPTGSAQ